MISEILHIKKQNKDINSQKDTECLDESYNCLLNHTSNENKWVNNFLISFSA